jgi:nucleotide-binding universal stress UspA family protein
MCPTIAVGVGGAGGWQALAWAAQEATATRAHLVIHHVCPPTSLLARSPGSPSTARLELADPALGRAVAAVRAKLGGDRVRLLIHTGRPGPVLVDAATAGDLLIIGTGTHGGTVHHVVRHARCPVVVVRPVVRSRSATFAGHVVIGVDGSAAARAALEFGFGYAHDHRLPVAAVHVSALGRADYFHDDVTLSTHFTVEPAELELLAEEVEPWSHKYPQTPVKRAVLAGGTVDGLVRAGEGAGLLVIGDKHRGPVSRVATGNVPLSVVDRAPCAVAVVAEDRLR